MCALLPTCSATAPRFFNVTTSDLYTYPCHVLKFHVGLLHYYWSSSSSSSSSVTSYALIGLFRPRLIVTSKVFQVFFLHMAYTSNSTLFLATCRSFLLHVVANLICIFLVSRLLVILHYYYTTLFQRHDLHPPLHSYIFLSQYGKVSLPYIVPWRYRGVEVWPYCSSVLQSRP